MPRYNSLAKDISLGDDGEMIIMGSNDQNTKESHDGSTTVSTSGNRYLPQDSNTLILPSKKLNENLPTNSMTKKVDGRGRIIEGEVEKVAKKLSKSQRKRLAQIEERKRKEARRGELYKRLEKNRVTEEQRKLLLPTKSYSSKSVSMKNRLKRAFDLERAGIEVMDEKAKSLLYQNRNVTTAVNDDSEVPSMIPNFYSNKDENNIVQKREDVTSKYMKLLNKNENPELRGNKRTLQEVNNKSNSGENKMVNEGRKRRKLRKRLEKEEELEQLKRKQKERRARMSDSDTTEESEEDSIVPEILKDANLKENILNMHSEREDIENGNDNKENDDNRLDAREVNNSEEDDDEDVEDSEEDDDEDVEDSEEDDDEDVEDSENYEDDEMVEVGDNEVCSRKIIDALKEHIMLSLGESASVGVHEDNKNSVSFVSSGKNDKKNSDEIEEDARLIPYKPVPELPTPQEEYRRQRKERIKKLKEEGKTLEEWEKERDEKKLKNYVEVQRSSEVEGSRSKLPVCGMEQEIMEKINKHNVVILCGETGSGKSTQLPQFLYEAGYAHGYRSKLYQQNDLNTVNNGSLNEKDILKGKGGMIGITQPRRVAATSTATRVAHEMNSPVGKQGFVGYQIRYDSSGITDDTKIKFMTDGILLQEVAHDLLLRSYSCILLDEAHERNLNTDVLLGLLSRIIPLREKISKEEHTRFGKLSKEQQLKAQEKGKLPLDPLKLIVMSATLRVTDFTENPTLFPIPPPVVKVEARQFPVTIHFNRVTPLEDPVDAVYRKVSKIHKRLPPGGILVFLTGRQEILSFCKKLNNTLKVKKRKQETKKLKPYEDSDSVEDDTKEEPIIEEGGIRELDDDEDEGDAVIDNVDDYADHTSDEDDIMSSDSDSDTDNRGEDSDEEEEPVMLKQDNELTEEEMKEMGNALSASNGINFLDDSDDEKAEGPQDVLVLPLFSLLSAKDQALVFQTPPENTRLIIVSTNVAETSVTIPGIKYVVDMGKEKRRVYDSTSSSSSYQVMWISKASADQRAGRAGRTGPGHCYRLYSSAVYQDRLEQFADPQVMGTPLEEVLLHMAGMGIHPLDSFPFPTAPPPTAIHSALTLLTRLGALKRECISRSLNPLPSGGIVHTQASKSDITQLGKAMASLPIGGRYAKMIILARQAGSQILSYILSLVAVLSEKDPIIMPGFNFKPSNIMQEEGEPEVDIVDAGIKEEQELLKSRLKADKMDKLKQWIHPNSDALARLKAGGAYGFMSVTYSRNKNKISTFCEENQLHEPTMERSFDLRRQLCKIVNRRYCHDNTYEPEPLTVAHLPPPSLAEETILRRILLAGFVDNTAKLAPLGWVQSYYDQQYNIALAKDPTNPEFLNGPPKLSRLQLQCAYISANPSISEPLYIHPHSSLFHPEHGRLPEWVTFTNLVQNKKGMMNMVCVTAIENVWFSEAAKNSPLLTISPPLAVPSPYYDVNADRIKCYVTPKFGSKQWELSTITIPIREAIVSSKGNNGEIYAASFDQSKENQKAKLEAKNVSVRWFARLLLEGKIHPGFLDLKTYLNDPPALITFKKPLEKVVSLTRALLNAKILNESADSSSNDSEDQSGVDTLESLIAIWKRQAQAVRKDKTSKNTFLKPEIKNWIKPEYVEEFEAIWEEKIIKTSLRKNKN